MLSLPLITPRDDSPLWPPALPPPPDPAPPPQADHLPTTPLPTHHTHHRRPTSHHTHHRGHPSPPFSPLLALTLDENAIAQRKQNVRRFGAGWLRPPGVAKTYQASMDEAAEREEQEMLARREQELLELASAQEEATAAAAAAAAAGDAGAGAGAGGGAEGGAQGEEEEGVGERDLDDEVPEAESDGSEGSDGDGDEGEDGGGDGEGEMTFNGSSFLEGSIVAADAEVEQMLEMEEAGVLQDERDLDDDVPEAGSYQHTDTELEDSSSDIEVASSVALGSSVRRSARGGRAGGGVVGAAGMGVGMSMGRGVGVGVGRSLFGEDGSELGESSLLASSPAAARAPGLGNAFRNRLVGPRAPRGG
ncbi:uncharacterized protein K441DRAFT_707318 [Cenococcum geophilum 1.58]|uniref:uncharacterized protein n=1 Tax=Cenococcum geophilum 1.58 TaxID=794803 RepID=UPI00358E0C6B|nr:hypothetical protein K441DRAFT_707318 [Cenococcum geophilum 1.58]